MLRQPIKPTGHTTILTALREQKAAETKATADAKEIPPMNPASLQKIADSVYTNIAHSKNPPPFLLTKTAWRKQLEKYLTASKDMLSEKDKATIIKIIDKRQAVRAALDKTYIEQNASRYLTEFSIEHNLNNRLTLQAYHTTSVDHVKTRGKNKGQKVKVPPLPKELIPVLSETDISEEFKNSHSTQLKKLQRNIDLHKDTMKLKNCFVQMAQDIKMHDPNSPIAKMSSKLAKLAELEATFDFSTHADSVEQAHKTLKLYLNYFLDWIRKEKPDPINSYIQKYLEEIIRDFHWTITEDLKYWYEAVEETLAYEGEDLISELKKSEDGSVVLDLVYVVSEGLFAKWKEETIAEIAAENTSPTLGR